MRKEILKPCELCGKKRMSNFVIKTGVSAYEACGNCYHKWWHSDQTVEALRELQDQKANR